ncbi:MAG: cytochrome c-type biogenesis protein CcmH [Pelagibacterales bacterium]|nr:cytochrome c-type biogenesis protein CcmH [Pelagibacterales bacterium]
MKSSQYIFHILIAYSLLLSSVYALNVDQEERANNLFKETRCLVCEGQNIYESNSDSAEDMKKLISEMIIDGNSDNEIKSFLVSRYGDWIIMTPPINQSTYFLWFSPIIILLIGIIFILRKFKKNG